MNYPNCGVVHVIWDALPQVPGLLAHGPRHQHGLTLEFGRSSQRTVKLYKLVGGSALSLPNCLQVGGGKSNIHIFLPLWGTDKSI